MSDLIPSVSGSEFPGEGKQQEKQCDFIDRKQGAEILQRCFKERHAGGLKERLVWAIHDPMCPDVKSKERPLAAIHPLFLYAAIFVAVAIAVFAYFHLKRI